MESEIDSLGDPALWIWVVYDVEEVDLEAAHQAERKIQSLISEAGDQRWVYARFRTREEDANTDEDDEDENGWRASKSFCRSRSRFSSQPSGSLGALN